MANTPNLGLRKIDSKTEKFNQKQNYEDNFDKIDAHAGDILAQLAETANRIDNIIVTPAVGVSEQEILDARQGKGSLGANIAEVKSQLAEKANQDEVDSLSTDKADLSYVNNVVNDIGINQINKNKGKLDQTYLSEDLLQQIAGTTPINAVPADNSITENKLANKSLTTSKLSDDVLEYIQGGVSINNLITIGNMGDGTDANWTIKGGGTKSTLNNILTFIPDTYNSNIAINNNVIPLPSKESVYYVGVYVKGNAATNKLLLTTLEGDLDTVILGDTYSTNTLYFLRGNVKPSNTGLTIKLINYTDNTTPIEISKLVVTNLTKAYGKDLEPSASEITAKLNYATNNNFYIDYGVNAFIDKRGNEIQDNVILENMLNVDLRNKINSKSYKFKVKANNDDYCEIITPYTSTTYLSLLFQRTGNNNIFNFKHVLVLNYNMTNNRYLASLGTDWFGPYGMEAVNNGDGNSGTAWFTGGNHNDSGKPTGRTLHVNIYCDNKIVENIENEYDCNEVKIEWVNRIQAMNTVKIDGSGREVLEEKYTLTIKDLSTILVENKITALEDILVKDYYGLQHTNSGWIASTYYVGDSNKKLLNNNVDTDSGTLGKANKKISFSATDVIEMCIDKTEGVGAENIVVPSIFARGGKSYCNAMKNKAIASGDINLLKGYYKFYSNN